MLDQAPHMAMNRGDDIEENAPQGKSEAPAGKRKGDRAMTGAVPTDVVARGSPDELEELGGAPDRNAASSTSGNPGLNLMTGKPATISDHDCDLNSSVGRGDQRGAACQPNDPIDQVRGAVWQGGRRSCRLVRALSWPKSSSGSCRHTRRPSMGKAGCV